MRGLLRFHCHLCQAVLQELLLDPGGAGLSSSSTYPQPAGDLAPADLGAAACAGQAGAAAAQKSPTPPKSETDRGPHSWRATLHPSSR